MRTIEEYLELPYRVVLTHDTDEDGRGGLVAEVEELPGCISQGSNASEAFENLRDAMAGWLSVALGDGLTIPEPRDTSHSGKFLVRLPASLHAQLARAAEQEHVSLNQFTANALSAAVGWRQRDLA